MQIVDLAASPANVREQAARLLVEHFDEPRGWTSLEAAREEVARVIADGFARAIVEGEMLLGWAGGLAGIQRSRVGIASHGGASRASPHEALGRKLAAAFEAEAAARGALTMTLGTDDDSGMTSLSGVDLYRDLPRHIAQLQDLGRNHPFLFYAKLGYVVTGVMPDANGPGRPDIYMSKPVRAASNPDFAA